MDSTRRGIAVFLLLLAILALLPGCGALTPPPETPRPYVTYHTVRPGDTLYSIAWRYGYDYHEVAAWNRIGSPYRIYVGQRLIVTPTASSVVTTPPPPVTTSSSSRAPAVSTPAPGHPSQPATKAPPASSVEKPAVRPHESSTRWQWPTTGRIKRGFTDGASKKGLDISGKGGQPIYAASAGDVVYSGSGLVGYGNLIIIKHDEVFLSAYGYNRRLLVKEGETVKAGQMIAEMGETAKDGALLHFEIRQEGKPVDPQRYLPQQNR